jgi:hypothetical protein
MCRKGKEAAKPEMEAALVLNSYDVVQLKKKNNKYIK